MRKESVYFADFETATANTQYFKRTQDTRVLLYCLKNHNGAIISIGVNIKQFFDAIKDMRLTSKEILIYFHNLSFDGDFILKWLAQNNFVATNPEKDDKMYKKPNTFIFLRQKSNIFFIKVWLNNKKGKKICINFYCSLKILSASVDALGKSIGLSKHTNETKQENFYDVEPMNHVSDYPKEFVDYCIRDCEIVRISFWNFVKELKQLTDSKWFLGNISLKKHFTIGSIAYQLQKDFVKNFSYKNKNPSIFKGLKIKSRTYWLAKRFYFGGITQFNPECQYKKIHCENGVSYDVNSMHPFSMTKLIPYGELYDMDEVQPEPNRKYLEYWEIYVEYASIKEHNFHCLTNWKKVNALYEKEFEKMKLRTKGKKPSDKDIKEQSKRAIDYTLNRYVNYLYDFTCYYLKEEWETLQKFYDFEGVIIKKKYWAYADYFLKDYVESLYSFKESYTRAGDKSKALTYKIALNSSYGKHATREYYNELYCCNSKQEYDVLVAAKTFKYKNKTWTIDDASEIVKLPNHYFVSIEPAYDESKDLFNKLIASTITAWSRIYIYESIYKCGVKNFLYCDTDSIYLKDASRVNLVIDNYKLGAWSVQSTYNYFIAKGAKVYSYAQDEYFKNSNSVHSGISKNYLAKNFDLSIYETHDIVLKEANLKQVRTKSGSLLVKKDYKSFHRTT